MKNFQIYWPTLPTQNVSGRSNICMFDFALEMWFSIHVFDSKTNDHNFNNLHARIQKVLSQGVQLWKCFFIYIQGREDPNKYHYKRAIIDPPAKRHLNGVLLAGRWWPNIECWIGTFVIIKGIRTSFAKEPYIFVIFQGVRTPCPTIWIRPWIWLSWSLGVSLSIKLTQFGKIMTWLPEKWLAYLISVETLWIHFLELEPRQ